MKGDGKVGIRPVGPGTYFIVMLHCQYDVIFLEMIFVSILHFIHISDYQDIKTEVKKGHLVGFIEIAINGQFCSYFSPK